MVLQVLNAGLWGSGLWTPGQQPGQEGKDEVICGLQWPPHSSHTRHSLCVLTVMV